ncbi:MAG: hypothetical protein COA79_09280 [Planctomycetota bacterium]|nr:MAG: hypothetical protein COA79_09280 [Planctomycetota bacterium]
MRSKSVVTFLVYIMGESFKYLLRISFLLALVFSSQNMLYSADRYYVGSGNWNDTSKWSLTDNGTTGVSVPGAGDQVYFTNNSGACSIDIAVNVQGLDIAATYASTITQQSSFAINVGGGNFIMAAGTFTGSADSFVVAGNCTMSGGILTSTALFQARIYSLTGGTFDPGSAKSVTSTNTTVFTDGAGLILLPSGGSFTFEGSNHFSISQTNTTFNDLIINKCVSCGFGGTVTVDGNLTLTSSGGISGTVNLRGDLLGSGGANASGTVTFDGTGDQNINFTGVLPRMTINKASGTLNFLSDFKIYKGFTYTAGLTNEGTSTVDFNGSDHLTLNAGAFEFYNLELNRCPTCTININTLNVKNDFTMTSVASLNGTLNVGGDFTNTDTAVGGSSTITFNGTSDQAFNQTTGTLSSGTINIDKTAGSLILGSNASITNGGGSFVVTNGTFDLNGYDFSHGNALTIYDTLKLKGNETLTINGTTGNADANSSFTLSATSSTVTFYDSAVTAIVTNVSQTFFDLNFGGGKIHEMASGVGNGLTIEGTLASNGSSISRSILRSVGDASVDWELTLNGTSTLADLVIVKHSDAGGNKGVLATNSVDMGNNTNWVGIVAPSAFTWTGATNNNFTEDTNWFGGTAPNDTQTAILHGTYSIACNVNGNIDIGGLVIEGSYSSTLTQQAGNTMTIGDSGFSQTGGTFAGGNSEIAITGELTLAGGNFTSTSADLKLYSLDNTGGTYTHNNGRFYLNYPVPWIAKHTKMIEVNNSITLYDFKVSGTASTVTETIDYNIGAGDTIIVMNDFEMFADNVNLESVQLNVGTVEVRGNLTVGTNAFGGTALIKVNGNTTQKFSGTTGYFPKVELDTSGSLAPNTAQTYFASYGFTLTSGAFTAPSGDFICLDDFTQVSGTYTHNSGTFGIVRPSGWNNSITTNIDVNTSISLNNLKYSGTGGSGVEKHTIVIATGDTLVVNGNFEITEELANMDIIYTNGGTIDLKGNISATDICYGGTTTVTITGNSAQTYTDTNSEALPGIVVNTSGSFSPAGGNVNFSCTEFNLILGTVNIPTGKFTVRGDFTIGGGTLNLNNCELVLSPLIGWAATKTIAVDVVNSLTVYDLTLSGWGNSSTEKSTFNLQGSDNLIVLNNFVLESEKVHPASVNRVAINGGSIELQGNVDFGAVGFGGTTPLTFTGTNNQVINYTSGVIPGGNYIINKTSGKVTLAANLDLETAGQDLELVDGELDLAGFNLTVKDVFTVYDSLSLKGSETITVNGVTTNANVNANFTISATSSTVTYYDSAVTANVTNLANTFYGLYLGAGKTHEFASGVGNGITIEGTIGSNGSCGNASTLRSVGDAAIDWELTLNGTSTLANKVIVKRSNASLNKAVLATNSYSLGNNTNWVGLITVTDSFWVGGTNSNFSVATNWYGNAVPGNTDIAVFSCFSNASCSVDVAVNVQGFDLKSTYAGTISQNANTMAIGSSGWLQSGGTFIGGSSAITCENFTLTNGVYVASSGLTTLAGAANIIDASVATFTHNNGSVRFSQNGVVHTYTGNPLMYDIDFNGSTSQTINGTLSAANNIIITTIHNYSGTGIVYYGGNLTLKDSTFSGSSTKFTANGAGAQSISSTVADGFVPALGLDKPSGTLTLLNDIELFTMSYTQGTWDAGTSEVNFIGGSATLDLSAITFYDVRLSKAGNFTLISDFIVSNRFELASSNSLTGNPIKVGGDFIFNDPAMSTNTLKFILNGTGDQNVTCIANADFPGGGFEINKPSGSVILTQALSGSKEGDWKVINGTLDLAGFDFDIGTKTLTVSDTLQLKGNETITGTVSLSATSSNVVYSDSAVTAVVTNLATNFYSLTFGAGKTHEFATGGGNGITIAGTMGSNGTKGNRSLLRSVGDVAVDWELTLNGTSTLGNKVAVKRSNASFAKAILAVNSEDLGNNTNWVGISLPSTITSITSSTSDGSYKAGSNIDITLNFSTAMTLVGTMGVTLDTGAVITINAFNNATYAQGVYTVSGGENSADLSATNIVLSGTATDSNCQDLIVAMPATNINTGSDIIIDTVTPQVSGIVSSSADESYGAGSNVSVRLTFSESITLTGTIGLNLNSGGLVVFTGFTGTTAVATYTVLAGENSSDLSGTIITVSGTASDVAGNVLLTTLPGTNINTGSDIVIDTTAPTITSILSTSSSDSYRAGENITVQVNFSESVTLSGGNLVVALNSGGSVSITPFTGTTSSGVYTVLATENANPLNATGVSLSAGTLTDNATNAVGLVVPGTNINPSKTIIVDTVVPTITGGAIGALNAFIDVTFAEPVYTTNGGTGGLNVADFNLTFVSNGGSATGVTISGVTTTAGSPCVGGETTFRLSLSVTGSVSGVETIAVTPNTNQIHDLAGNPALNATTTGALLLFDLEGPSVVSLAAVTANGYYKAGQTIDIKITFTENVIIVGSPQLLFETGTTDRNAIYKSGTGSTEIIFEYTIVSGDASLDLDAVSTTSLTLNGGTIQDGSGNNATLVLPTPGTTNSLGNNSAIVIDANAPSIIAGALGVDNAYVDITFIEGVYNNGGTGPVTTAGFSLTFNQNGGIATGVTITGVQKADGNVLVGGETVIRVLIQTTGVALGVETINIDGVSSKISDIADNALAASSTGLMTLITQGTVPTVLSITAMNDDGIYGTNQLITLEVKFSENVFVTGIPFVELETGATNKFAIYGGGSGSDTLTFNYVIREGDVSSDLDYASASAFSSAVGKIHSSLSIPVNATLVDPGAVGSLGANKNIRIETLNPMIISITTTAVDGTYGIGASIPLAVHFSREVTLAGGDIKISLNSGVDLIVGHLIGTLISLDYLVEEGEQTSDLSIVSITLEGSATLLDSKGVANSMTLPTPLFVDEHEIKIEALASDYLISAIANSGGSISPVGATPVIAGANQAFTIAPNEGYHIEELLIDGVKVAVVSSYTFTSVNNNHSIEVVFVQDQTSYTIVSNSSIGGSVSPAGATTVDVNNDHVVSIIPDAGYHISDVLVDGVSLGAISLHTFSSVNAGHTLQANFSKDKISYVITVNSNGSGTVSPSGNVSVDHGFDKLFSFTPNTGYHVADVKVDGISVGVLDDYIFSTVLAYHTLSVDFVKDELSYVVFGSTNTGGSISPSGFQVVLSGASQIFDLTAQSGYHLVDVQIDGVPQGAKSNIILSNIQKDTTVHGVFAKDQVSYLIVLNVPFEKNQTTVTFEKNSETIDLTSLGTTSLLASESGTIAILVKDGYHIADVKINGSSIGVVKSVTLSQIKSDQLVDVFIEKDQAEYLITTNIIGQGSVTPSQNITVISGADQGLTILASDNHHIQDVIVDGESLGSVSSLYFGDVTSNHTVLVIFAEDKASYTIGSSSMGSGSISPSGETTIEAGKSVSYIFNPDAEYQLVKLTINGESKAITSSLSYMFINVQADQSIVAFFDLIKESYNVNVTHSSGGVTSIVGDTSVLHGNSFTITINPENGFHIKDVKLDGESIGSVSTLLVSNIIADHKVEVVFEADAETYTIKVNASSNGALQPANETVVVAGDSHLVQIIPNAGFRVLNVEVDGVSKGPLTSYVFTHISANHEIQATFIESEKALTILTRVNGVGTVTPEGFTGIALGDSLLISIAVDNDHKIVDVIVDGVSKGAVETYRFNNVIEDHFVDVYFAEVNSEVDVVKDPVSTSGSGGGCSYQEDADDSNLWSLLLTLFITITFVRFFKK